MKSMVAQAGRQLRQRLLRAEVARGCSVFGGNPVWEGDLDPAVGARGGVLLVDGGQSLSREAASNADQRRPEASMDERHLSVDQPGGDDLVRCENLTTAKISCPASCPHQLPRIG
jgi:hypothetical protein